MLDAQIDRKLHRLLLAISRKARKVQIGKTTVVEPFLNSGNTLVIDVHESNEVRHLRTARIDTLVLAQESNTGNAETMNFLLLHGRDFTLQPDKSLARG